jgi:hypothetical protein
VREGDLEWFAEHMRESDKEELRAASGPCLLATLRLAVLASAGLCAVAEENGVPVALFGFAPWGLLSDTASPWLVGTDRLFKLGRPLNRMAKAYCARATLEFPVLVNYVDVRNTASVRWLRGLGFKMDEPAPFGIEGRPFMRFSNV